jgi:MoaA/NifB/PqqE/SkfB family radical SAM enzyme
MARCTPPAQGADESPTGAGPRPYGHRLILVHTTACPLRCSFCCHPPEDYGSLKMRKEDVIDWIRQTDEVDALGLVVFTGGEPFLYHRELVEILGATHRPGLQFRIVTAAHWAPTVDDAVAKLKPLEERGLSELSISTDPTHQEFVPVSYAENAARAALELGVVAEIASVFWRQGERIEDTVDVPDGARKVTGLVAPIGRAKRAGITAESYAFEGDERFGPCGDPPFYDVTIYPDGEVYPCCAGGFQVEAGLSCGNLHRERLVDVFARMRSDRYVRQAVGVGLRAMYEVAKLKFPEIRARLPRYENIAGVCELCAIIHSDPETMAMLEPVQQYLDRVIEARDEMSKRSQQAASPEARVPS